MDRIQIKVKRPRPTPSQSPAIRRSQPGRQTGPARTSILPVARGPLDRHQIYPP